ncbi:MAG: DoxX family protein [Bacteroidetes bacterium]|nr:DoxX family protein [Bacteroidota bacterium]
MIWKSSEKYTDVGLLVLRVGFGVGFIYYHGWDKITGGPERWEGLGGAMSRLGINFLPTFWGFMMSFAESVGALMIAAGFLFRPLCAILAFGMFVAWLGHVVSGRGNPGHPFKNFFVLVGVMLIGPGKYSVDSWLEKRRSSKASEKQVEAKNHE